MPSTVKPITWVLAAIFGGLTVELAAQTPEPTPEKPQPEAAAPAEATTTDAVKEAPADVANAETKEEETKLGPSFNVTLSHTVGAKEDVDPLTILDLTARYKLNDKVSFSGVQRISKLYEKDEGDDEVQFADTSLRANYSIFTADKGPAGIGLSTGLDLTLPVSEFSKEQKVKTVAGASVTGTRAFGPVSVLLRPFYKFHANGYKTLDRDDGGQTVVRYRLGVRFDLSLELPASLTLTSSNQWIERHYEDPPYGSHAPDHDYNFDISLSYALDKKTSFALGYNEANRAEQLGVVDVNLYDVESTTYYVSASREF